MQTLPIGALPARSLPPPLTLAGDMPSVWSDLDCAFDAAAHRVVDAHLQDGVSLDVEVADLRAWGVIPSSNAMAIAPLARHLGPFALRGTAFSQLSGRLGAPPDFLKKLPAPLQLANLNWLLSSHAEAMSTTLRLRGDEVAAVVSDRYAALDAEQLLDSVRAALANYGALSEVRVRSLATGPVDVLRLVFPAEVTAVKVGDISALGVDISTSSFARSAVHVRGLVWRLKCTNGLRVAESRASYSFRHVGDPRRLRDGIAEAIPAALEAAQSTMSLWRRAVTLMVDEVSEVVAGLRELTLSEKKSVEAALRVELDVAELPPRAPLFEVVNAITEAAKASSPQRRLDIEGVAGSLLARHARRAA